MIQAFTHDIKRLIEVTPVQNVEGEVILAKVYLDGEYKGIANTVRPDEDAGQLQVTLTNSSGSVQTTTATIYGKQLFEDTFSILETINFQVDAGSTVDMQGHYDPQDYDEFKVGFSNNSISVNDVTLIKRQYDTAEGLVLGGPAEQKIVVPCDFRRFVPAEEYHIVFIAKDTGVIGRDILNLFGNDGYEFNTFKANSMNDYNANDITLSVIRSYESQLRIHESQITDLSHFSGEYSDLSGTPALPNPLTDEQVRSIIGATLKAGTNITINVDDAANTITINSVASSGGGLSSEQVRDIIGSVITAGSDISVNVDDANDTITIASTLTPFSGNYNDLNNKPVIPSDNSDLDNGAGYITNYIVTQTDVTQYAESLSITESQITDLGNYIEGITNENLENLSNVIISSPSAGQALKYDGTNWINGTDETGGGSGQLTQEQVEDFVGGMLTGNTQTLISVTYQDGDGTIDFIVDNDLSNYDNANAGFITDYTVTEIDVTQHEAALSILENQISDLGDYIEQGANISLLTNDSGYITGYTVTQADVTQYQGAITITESQISDLTHFSGDYNDLTNTPVILPTQDAGVPIFFDSPKIYNTPAAELTGNITQDLTGATLGVVQKIYHSDSSEPTFPSEWVLIGNSTYSPNVTNIIYAEYISSTRIEYWITQ